MKKWRKIVGKLEGERTAILIEDNGLLHKLTYPLASYGGVPESDWRLNGIPSEKYRYLYFNEKR